MTHYTLRKIKLEFQILYYGNVARFFKWMHKRWNARLQLIKWNKFYDTLIHMKDMDQHARNMILMIMPYDDLKFAMDWKALNHVVTGKIT